VRQLQGHPPQGRGARDLHEPKAQAAARVIEFSILDFELSAWLELSFPNSPLSFIGAPISNPKSF
jgi:hypothetical protein